MLFRVTWGLYQSSFGGVEGRGSLVGLNFKERQEEELVTLTVATFSRCFVRKREIGK